MPTMRTLPTFAAAISILLLAACGQNEPVKQPTATQPAPGSVVQPVQTMGEPAAQSMSSAGTPALNPPHGEPGHVCEIPVGSPLDGSAAPAPAPTMAPAPPSMIPTQSLTIPANGGAPVPSGSMSGKPNPPHGEPGHVCELGVGEILP